MIKNPYQNFATRKLQLVTNERTKVLDFDLDTGETWQAWIFSNEVTNKSTLVQFDLRGSFGTIGSIETTIGGGENAGNIITGSGACIVFATGNSNNVISVWFTPEQKYFALPPKSQKFSIALAGTSQNLGYPPFGRNYYNVQSNGSFKTIYEDDNGNTLNSSTITSNTHVDKIYHPSNTQLKIEATNPGQHFVVSHYRS